MSRGGQRIFSAAKPFCPRTVHTRHTRLSKPAGCVLSRVNPDARYGLCVTTTTLHAQIAEEAPPLLTLKGHPGGHHAPPPASVGPHQAFLCRTLTDPWRLKLLLQPPPIAALPTLGHRHFKAKPRHTPRRLSETSGELHSGHCRVTLAPGRASCQGDFPPPLLSTAA